MIRFVPRGVLLLLLLVAGCSQKSPQQQQCEDIIARFTALSRFAGVEVKAQAGTREWVYQLELKSALGPQRGEASCLYSVDAGGQLAQRPLRVTIGDSVFSSAKDISDLLTGAPDVHGH